MNFTQKFKNVFSEEALKDSEHVPRIEDQLGNYLSNLSNNNGNYNNLHSVRWEMSPW